jgi:hypothetical protein
MRQTGIGIHPPQILPGIFNSSLKGESVLPVFFDLANQFDIPFRKSSVLRVPDIDFLNMGKIPVAPLPQLVFWDPYHLGYRAYAVSPVCFHLQYLQWT